MSVRLILESLKHSQKCLVRWLSMERMKNRVSCAGTRAVVMVITWGHLVVNTSSGVPVISALTRKVYNFTPVGNQWTSILFQ